MQIPNQWHATICFVLACVTIPAGGQENAKPADHPCISQDEVVYAQGDVVRKKIKPPKMDVGAQEQMPEAWKGGALLEFVVNSEGRVCDVHVVAASDKDAAVRAAKHVAEHWKFKPATLDGKAVAARVEVMFGDGTGGMLFKAHDKPPK